MPDDSQPQWQLEERGDHQCGDHGEGEDHILPDSSPGLAADPDGQWQGFEIIAHQDDVSDFKCDIRSGAAHGDTEMCGGECRGIIHAVADHGNGVAGCGQLSDLYNLLIGQLVADGFHVDMRAVRLGQTIRRIGSYSCAIVFDRAGQKMYVSVGSSSNITPDEERRALPQSAHEQGDRR